MLVLSRKANQTILVGQDIEITVVSVKGGQVRIGIRAPQHVAVLRGELLEEVRSSTSESRVAGRSQTPVLHELARELRGSKRSLGAPASRRQ